MAVHRSRLHEAGSLPALLDALGAAHPRLGERLAYRASDAPIDAIANVPYGWRERGGAAGLFRLGDQAGVIPSLAGEGMGIALASGISAADACLRDARRGWRAEPPPVAASAQIGAARCARACDPPRKRVIAGPSMARARTSRSAPAPRSRWRRRIVVTLQILIGLGILAFGALVIAVYVARSQLPSFDELKSSPNGQMIRVHAADGSIIASLGPSYGEWLPYAQIPRIMRQATVAVEDRRFRGHPGVDPIGIARSVQVRFERGRWVQGGSTITQQLARNVFLNNQKKFGRKFREWILALALERKFSKDEILELYLNKMYYGGGTYGIDAASRKFFGHGANHLSIGEAAVIAGLVKAPSNYSPTADAEAARGRAGVVLQQMVRAGDITEAQAQAADVADLKLTPERQQNSARYFTDWALPQLDTLIDETSAPLEVWTTLDPAMQREADAAIRANAPNGVQGALVSLDRDGGVRAMVGGKDYVTSIYNRATQAVRQPGSAFKLFVYLAALEAGHKPEDTIVDEPVTIDGWSPRNDSRRNSGPVSLRTAFAYSLNTVAAKLGQEVGFSTIAAMARRFGITTPINTHPAMVLGTSDVRLIDMTSAFASVANKGVAVTPPR
ncbi:hypothetical protein WR25_10284 [Diploscapter pachys]|uniref:peptidoglycan glycosyltransferase n=1 Tax=Diploscapter pachys TaxID=2018661 RepID=A0A2A2K139_9BILA|nr:hypothetical protein WR25_10284 [Diploscapter pachys]